MLCFQETLRPSLCPPLLLLFSSSVLSRWCRNAQFPCGANHARLRHQTQNHVTHCRSSFARHPLPGLTTVNPAPPFCSCALCAASLLMSSHPLRNQAGVTVWRAGDGSARKRFKKRACSDPTPESSFARYAVCFAGTVGSTVQNSWFVLLVPIAFSTRPTEQTNERTKTTNVT